MAGPSALANFNHHPPMSRSKNPSPPAQRAKSTLCRHATVALLSGTASLGCSLGSFDYLSAEYQRQGTAGGAAGGASGSGAVSGGTNSEAGTATSGAPAIDNPCQDREDGTPCDDDDVCTPTSLCVSGACQGSGDASCVVANSIAEFSIT